MSPLFKKVMYLCTGVGLFAICILTIGALSLQRNSESSVADSANGDSIPVSYPVESDIETSAQEVDLDAIVDVKDLILLQVINRTLDRPSNTPVTVAQMQSLKSLVCSNCGITDLTGLEYATNLEMLEVHGNYISDLSAISNLQNLDSVCLGKNLIEDLSPLENLENLKTLEISHNKVSDLTPVSKIDSLESMSLSNNNISDLSPLASLQNLRQLNLQENAITDITTLSELENLQTVNLEQNPIEDMAPVFSVFNLPAVK
ncbi:MAG: leucine-rich repeat domain-containing protein [Turicibacter sp.]